MLAIKSKKKKKKKLSIYYHFNSAGSKIIWRTVFSSLKAGYEILHLFWKYVAIASSEFDIEMGMFIMSSCWSKSAVFKRWHSSGTMGNTYSRKHSLLHGQGRATSVLRDLLIHITYVAEVSTVLKYLVFIKHKNGSVGINFYYRVCLFVFFLLNKVKMLSVSDPSESSWDMEYFIRH